MIQLTSINNEKFFIAPEEIKAFKKHHDYSGFSPRTSNTTQVITTGGVIYVLESPEEIKKLYPENAIVI